MYRAALLDDVVGDRVVETDDDGVDIHRHHIPVDLADLTGTYSVIDQATEEP